MRGERVLARRKGEGRGPTTPGVRAGQPVGVVETLGPGLHGEVGEGLEVAVADMSSTARGREAGREFYNRGETAGEGQKHVAILDQLRRRGGVGRKARKTPQRSQQSEGISTTGRSYRASARRNDGMGFARSPQTAPGVLGSVCGDVAGGEGARAREARERSKKSDGKFLPEIAAIHRMTLCRPARLPRSGRSGTRRQAGTSSVCLPHSGLPAPPSLLLPPTQHRPQRIPDAGPRWVRAPNFSSSLYLPRSQSLQSPQRSHSATGHVDTPPGTVPLWRR